MRIKALIRLYLYLLIVFISQKALFMLFNCGLANGAPFTECLLALWHGLRLDSVMACYLLLLPSALFLSSYFFHRLPLRRVLSPYYIVVGLLLSAIFVADAVLYSFWGSKLDANDLIYAAHPKDLFASLPWWAAVLGILVIILIAWHYWYLLCRLTPKHLAPPRSPLSGLWMIPLIALQVLGMRGSLSESTANPSYAYFSPHPFCNHAALNPTFNMMHSLFKAEDLASEFNQLSESEVDSVLDGAFTHDTAIDDTLLTTSTPNILLIIWEGGGSGMVLNDSVAPGLWRLKDEGVFFNNCYANNFRTDRGLVSILNGWLGLPTTSLMKRSDLCRRLPSLARTLRSNGYATSFTYGGDIDFTNMRLYLSETGFDTVRGSHSFPSSSNQSAWGVPDHLVLTPNLCPRQGRFFSTVLTLSSHEPWQVPMRRLHNDRQNAFAYTDSCITALVDQLQRTPLWDSLLIIIVPDHGVTYPGVSSPADSRVARIPLLFLGGAVRQPLTIDRLMSQSDLAATLLSQLHLDFADFPFSRNVLSPNYLSQPQFVLHAYKNEVNLITPDAVATYDCVNRAYRTPEADSTLFTVALLQHLYTVTAALH